MTTAHEIPLSPEPQTFTISLSGQTYGLRLQWCKPLQAWCLDINDATGVPILQGHPIVTGCDLLAQFPDLGIGGSLVAQTDYAPDNVPTYENLGVLGRLFFITE